MLIDEADTFLRDHDELRGVLNAGHSRPTAYVIRTVGEDHEARAFCVWAPVAIALIGKLPSTLADCAIIVSMRRKLPHEQVARLRLDRLEEVEALRRRCLRWAQDHLTQLHTCDPPMPETLHDRAADNWRPLCAIATVAAGDWCQRVTEVITALTPQDLDDEAAGVLLLEDFHRLFTEKGIERIPSADVVAAVHHLEERPWSEWGRQEKPITARQIARLLAPFHIKSKTIRLGADTQKGYERADFIDAWARYLPLLSVTPSQASLGVGSEPSVSVTPREQRSVTPSQGSHGTGLRVSSSATASDSSRVADKYARTPALQAECDGVTDREKAIVTEGPSRNPTGQNGCDGVTV